MNEKILEKYLRARIDSMSLSRVSARAVPINLENHSQKYNFSIISKQFLILV